MKRLRGWVTRVNSEKLPRVQLIGLLVAYFAWAIVFGVSGLIEKWQDYAEAGAKSYWWLLGALVILWPVFALRPYKVDESKSRTRQYAVHGVNIAARGLMVTVGVFAAPVLKLWPRPALIVLMYLSFVAIPLVIALMAREFLVRSRMKQRVSSFYSTLVKGPHLSGKVSATASALEEVESLNKELGKPSWYSVTNVVRDETDNWKVQLVTTRNKSLWIEEAVLSSDRKTIEHIARVLAMPATPSL